jgi:voltage-gated potassium channel
MNSSLNRIRTGAISLTTIFVAAVVAYRLAGDYSWLESVWLVVVTISTVGFSESSESNAVVQIITILLILLGVSAAAYTCGGFIQLALEGEVERVLGRKKMTRELKKVQHHIIICGFGRLGYDLAKQLTHRDVISVVIDEDPERIVKANESGALSVTGDATDESVLEEANVTQAKAIVTALPTDAENVFIALTARNLNPDIQIIAKAESESSCRKLRQAGANKIVMPHRVGAQQMERMISRPTTADLVELFAEATHLDMELDEFRIGKQSGLVGKTLADSKIKDDFNLLVIGIKQGSSGEFLFNPKPDQTISVEDTILVIGDVEDINQMKTVHA